MRYPLTGVENAFTPSQSLLSESETFSTSEQSTVQENPNFPITSSKGVEQMPSIGVDPLDANHLVIAYMDYSLVDTGYAGIAVAVSYDGGASFKYGQISLPDGFAQGAANPTVQFDDSGLVYLVFMSATFFGERPPLTNPDSGESRALGFESNNGVFVARSDDGGLNWLPPIAVESHLFDGNDQVPFVLIPDIAIDTFPLLPNGTSNPHYGTIYVTFSRYYPAGQFPNEPESIGGSDLLIATSKDQGQTWTIRLKQDDSGNTTTVLQDPFNNGIDPPAGFGYNNYIHPTVGPEGDIYTAQFSAAWLPVNHSSDGANSFFIPTQEDEFGMPFGLGPVGLDFGLSSNEFRTLPVRKIVADPLRPGNVYVAEPQSVVDSSGALVDDSDIIFSRSNDYGQTWTRRFRVGSVDTQILNDDNQSTSATGTINEVISSQVMVTMATNAQGWIVVAWYDSRRDPANHLLDVFATISKDGGETFSPNFRITDESFDADHGSFIDGTGEKRSYIGDSFGLALSDTTLYATWTDTRGGSQDIYFSRIPLEELPPPQNDRFEPNETSEAATNLGQIIERNIPLLSVDSEDEDWFTFQSVATGSLLIDVSFHDETNSTRLELRNSLNEILPSEVRLETSLDGNIEELKLSADAIAGATYF